ncbi:MAG: hypothetical protein WCD07_05565 [Burkholderiales bacterium]
MHTATLTGSSFEDVDLSGVPDHLAFFSVALAFSTGINCLASAPLENALPLTFLCGQATECALKALLSKAGEPPKTLRSKDIRHNLTALWELAASKASLQPSNPPVWIKQLAEVHASPYVLRYPMGVNMIALPAPQPMLEGIKDLVAFTKASLAA